MDRKQFFSLVNQMGVPAALEAVGHKPEFVKSVPIGDGEYAEIWRCTRCGAEPEFVFANGTREDEREDNSLHGLYALEPIECRPIPSPASAG